MSDKRRIVGLTCLAVVAVVLSVVAWRVTAHRMAQSGAYTLTWVEESRDGDRHFMQARSSAGATVKLSDFPEVSKSGYINRDIVTESGLEIQICDPLKLRTSIQMTADAFASHKAATLNNWGKVPKNSWMKHAALSVGEPAAKYFDVPASYREVPPSALNIKWGEYFGIVATPEMIHGWQTVADAKYYAARKNPPLN